MKREMNRRFFSILTALVMLLACFGAAAETAAEPDPAAEAAKAAAAEAFRQEMLEKLGAYSFKDEFTLEIDAGENTGLAADVVNALATKMRGALIVTFRTEEGEEKKLTLYSRDAMRLRELDGTLNFAAALEQQGSAAYAQDLKIQEQIIAGETPKLPADGMIDPKIPRFMQATISNKTGDYTVLGNAEAIRNGTLTADMMPLCRLWMDEDGEIWTLDHRRLAAYKMGGLEEIPYRWATEVELSTEYWKMDTKDNGESMEIRMKREDLPDPVVHRDGTITGLWNDELVAAYQASMFSNEEVNKLIDDNYKEVQEKGYAELRIPRSLHGIQESLLTPNSLEVAHKLLDAGYEVYVIGGCVRDFILGKESNDIDFVTNASLEQQKEIFGEQLITHEMRGRTFGIVAYPDEKIDLCEPQNIPAEFAGLPGVPEFDPEKLTSDNILFDSFQRDLTINAIYYDVSNGDLVDFHGGIHDVRDHILNTMTDADAELSANSSVLLRAIRFNARFGFAFSEGLEKAVQANGITYLKKIDPYEVYSSISKMMIAGYATQAFATLDKYGLVEELYPSLKEMTADPEYKAYLDKALTYLDSHVRNSGENASRSLAMMTILLPAVDKASLENGLEAAIAGVLEKQTEGFNISAAVQSASDTTYLANYMSTIASRFHRSAIQRSEHYEDALVLLNLYGLLDDGIGDMITFWNTQAIEEPSDEETYQEEPAPTAEEAAQQEEQKLEEDLADAA